MNIEKVKELIADDYINANEAVWLNQMFNEFRFQLKEEVLIEIAKESLEFLNDNRNIIESRSVNDDIMVFSLTKRLKYMLSLSQQGLLDLKVRVPDDVDDEDYFLQEIYTKEQLEKLRKVEEALLNIDNNKLINQFIELIDEKYPLVYNGFDKREFNKAKREFWEIIELNDFDYFVISPILKKKLDDVFNESKQELEMVSEKKEQERLPTIAFSFTEWADENQSKINKTNLKLFLKRNGIRISNTNIDKIISDLR